MVVQHPQYICCALPNYFLPSYTIKPACRDARQFDIEQDDAIVWKKDYQCFNAHFRNKQ